MQAMVFALLLRACGLTGGMRHRDMKNCSKCVLRACPEPGTVVALLTHVLMLTTGTEAGAFLMPVLSGKEAKSLKALVRTVGVQDGSGLVGAGCLSRGACLLPHSNCRAVAQVEPAGASRRPTAVLQRGALVG